MVEQGVPLRETPPRDRRRPSRGRIVARRVVALVVLAVGLGLAVWLVLLALGSIRDGGSTEAKPVVPAAPPVLKIIFPEGFTRAEMAERITAVDRIARNRRKINPRLSSRAYLAATARSKIPAKFAEDRKRRNLEGFLFPSTYEFEPQTTSRQLVNRQLQAFRGQLGQGRPRLREVEEPDAVRRAHHRVARSRRRSIAPEERTLVAAVIYNRLKAGMNLGIDATTRYGLQRAADGAAPPVAPGELQPLQHAQPEHPRPAADADREPRARVDAGGRSSGEGRLPLLRPQGRQDPPLLHRERAGVQRLPGRPRRRMISGRTRLVALLGHPVADSLSPRDAERRLRGPRARLGIRRLRCRAGRLRDGRARARRCGLRRRERDDAAQGGRCASSRRPTSTSVNTLVFEDGRIRGYSTDAAVLDGVDVPSARSCSATAAPRWRFAQALPEARAFSRRGEWPPDVRDADLVVNATSVRDEVLVELGPGQTLVDLPYPETATAAAAREAGRERDRRARGARRPGRGLRSSSGRACPRRSR